MKTSLCLGSLCLIACTDTQLHQSESKLTQNDGTPSEKLTYLSVARQITNDHSDSLYAGEDPKFYLLGQFDPANNPYFISLEKPFADGSALHAFLRKETYDAFVAMYQAAKKENISLTILSATRNFHYQKRIWEAKWNGTRKIEGKNAVSAFPVPTDRALAILRYSSMPGTSRHHWGTDIDLNAFRNSYFESGEGLAIYTWLQKNAETYGFCQSYSAKPGDRSHGYEEEKWHWSYISIAGPLLESYQEHISTSDIIGFDGAHVADSLQVIDRYVYGISPACLRIY